MIIIMIHKFHIVLFPAERAQHICISVSPPLSLVCVCVCVCVCERERERERESARARVRVCMCVCVCSRARAEMIIFVWKHLMSNQFVLLINYTFFYFSLFFDGVQN